MIWMYRGLIGLMIVLFAVLGFGYYFDPVTTAASNGLEALDLTGVNALHGDFGGLFVGMVVLLVLGLLQPRASWLLAVAVVLAAIALGRVIGFVMHGTSEAAYMALGVEVICVIILMLASRHFTRV